MGMSQVKEIFGRFSLFLSATLLVFLASGCGLDLQVKLNKQQASTQKGCVVNGKVIPWHIFSRQANSQHCDHPDESDKDDDGIYSDPKESPHPSASASPEPSASASPSPSASASPSPSASASPSPSASASPSPSPVAGPQTVVFRIRAGTGASPWNSAASPVVLKVGDTLQVFNDDLGSATPKRIHTPGAPFPHAAANIPEGGSASYRCTSAADPATQILYNHNVGSAARFYVKVNP